MKSVIGNEVRNLFNYFIELNFIIFITNTKKLNSDGP